MALPVVRRAAVALALVLCLASPALAQIEDQLSAYTGKNAEGYMQPLVDAFGADLNSAIWRAAHIPGRPSVHLEVGVMSVLFGDDDRTFSAVTEGGFSPEQRAQAPTIVGSTKAVTVDGDGGTQYSFPGGFDLNSFALAVPQLRVGGIFGTEAILRYFAMQLGDEDEDLGDISFWGIGARHSVSQYFHGAIPFDLAAGFFYQHLSLGENERGDDLLASTAFTIGLQASKRFVRFVEPYAGVSLDTHSMDLSYDSDVGGEDLTVDVDFERTTSLHLTLGLEIDMTVLNLFAEYNLAGQSSFAFGLGLGY